MQQVNIRDQVYRLMAKLPEGRVTTYGDLAAFSGYAHAARRVGEIAHGGPIDLPWHRLVNYRGGLAVGFPGGKEVQKQLLEQEGVLVDDNFRVVNFKELRWQWDQ